MDSPLWQLRRTLPTAEVETRTPAAWGIESSSLKAEFLSQAADSLSFTVKRAFDDDDLFPYGTTIELLRVVDGTTTVVFLGRIVRAPRQGSNAGESIDYEAEGPWWWLDHLGFEQSWRFPAGLLPDGSFSLMDKPLTRLLLGRSLAGDKVAASAIITEVFAFLADKFDTPVTLGDLAPDFSTEIPAEEVRDLTCGEVIRRVLRWFPGITPRIALSPGAAVIHFKARAADRFTLDPAVQVFGPVSLTPRHDLRPTCVLVRYYRHNLFEAAEITPEAFDDKWPAAANAYGVDALRLFVQLDGGSINTISTKVKTAPIQVDHVTWWKTKLPYLNNPAVSAISVVVGDAAVALGVAAPTVVLDADAPEGAVVDTKELLDGSLPAWTNTRQSPCIAKATITYKVAVTGGGAPETRTEAVQCRIRSTNATQDVYSWVTDYQAPEPVPSGLARRYYEALDWIQHDGTVVLEQREWDGVNRVGWALDLAGFPKRPEWATMGASVVRQSVDLGTGRVTLTVGPAKHLVPDDWISLARPARGRTHSTSMVASVRTTGRLQAAVPGGAPAVSPAPAENLPRAAATTLVVSPLAGGGGAPAGPLAFGFSLANIDPEPTSRITNKIFINPGRVNGKFAKMLIPGAGLAFPTDYAPPVELSSYFGPLAEGDFNSEADPGNNRWTSLWYDVWTEYDPEAKVSRLYAQDPAGGAVETFTDADNQVLIGRVRTVNPYLTPGAPESYAPYWYFEYEQVNDGDQFIILGGGGDSPKAFDLYDYTRSDAVRGIRVKPGAISNLPATVAGAANIQHPTTGDWPVLTVVAGDNYFYLKTTWDAASSPLASPLTASVVVSATGLSDDATNAYLLIGQVRVTAGTGGAPSIYAISQHRRGSHTVYRTNCTGSAEPFYAWDNL